MKKRWVHLIMALGINLVFILVLSVKSIHFLTVSHEYLALSNSEWSWIPKKEGHYCDFQFIKNPFDYTNEFYLTHCLPPIIYNKPLGSCIQNNRSSLKYTWGLRAPPDFLLIS